MLRELLSIFRKGNPLSAMGENFAEMLRLTHELTVQAGDIYFGKPFTPEERTQIYKQDVRVNKLQRTIRKQVIAHLSIHGNSPHLPYCLLLISLVKDVERLGDYAKNLADIVELRPEAPPENEITTELREIRTGIDAAFSATAAVFASSDKDHAVQLIREGKGLAQRCDRLLERIAASEYDSRFTTSAVLGARYYKRIGGHILNVLSSVVMPLHKLDYYDEKELAPRPTT